MVVRGMGWVQKERIGMVVGTVKACGLRRRAEYDAGQARGCWGSCGLRRRLLRRRGAAWWWAEALGGFGRRGAAWWWACGLRRRAEALGGLRDFVRECPHVNTNTNSAPTEARGRVFLIVFGQSSPWHVGQSSPWHVGQSSQCHVAMMMMFISRPFQRRAGVCLKTLSACSSLRFCP